MKPLHHRIKECRDYAYVELLYFSNMQKENSETGERKRVTSSNHHLSLQPWEHADWVVYSCTIHNSTHSTNSNTLAEI